MATIFKSNEMKPTGDMPGVIAFNIDDLQTRGEAYLSEVRQQAAQIVEAAKKESEAVRTASRSTGLADAQKLFAQQVEERAQQLTEERIKTAVASCQQAIDQLSSETTRWLQQWRDMTVDIAIAMSEKLMRQSMAHGVEPLSVWLEEALMLMREARDVQILVHPDDFTWAGRYLQQMARHLPHAGTAEVLPDPEISVGGCIVRSPQGEVDLQLETQLARLAEQLK